MPPQEYPHIQWRRINRVVSRGKRQTPFVPPSPPLRPSQGSHGTTVVNQIAKTASEISEHRKAAGIDPNRLLVIEMRFLGVDERAILEKIGIRILDERKENQPVTPHYALVAQFESADRLHSFVTDQVSTSLGINRVERTRESSGVPHPTRLLLCFPDRPAATAFRNRTDLAKQHGFQINGAPQRARMTSHVLLVEFPSHSSLVQFQEEAAAYRDRRQGTRLLPQSERSGLFDALDEVRALSPDDRTGPRLKGERFPEGREKAFFDVDLWHPGNPADRGAVIREFRDFVENAGGRVTDGPTTVAETLLLGRVEIPPTALPLLLNHDRIALVDLPPRAPAIVFSAINATSPPDFLPPIPDDGPIACVLDSGVVAGHPLLQGLIVDERDFETGENTPVDRAGHGTFVAGIVVYGNVRKCAESGDWTPYVRVLSGKVLKEENGVAVFPEDDERRIESRFRESIEYFAKEHDCRIFNLSLGHYDRLYSGGRQLPWAMVLDEIARDLDVVLVVAAGNANPQVPDATTSIDFQSLVREQLFSDEHYLTDPATAMIALTVGSISRNGFSVRPNTAEHQRADLAGSPRNCPSPFTRAGIADSSRSGPARAIKPDLVAYGGNFAVSPGSHWYKNDVALGEWSLRHDFQAGGSILKVASGTSNSTPFVTHVAARVEHMLRKLVREDYRPSSNLIRAITAHSARNPDDAKRWLAEGHTPSDGERRLLRLCGYGLPDPVRALASNDQFVLLFAEDSLAEGTSHIYELELPDSFCSLASRRRVRLTLAYDPPIRGSRRDYLARRLSVHLIDGGDVAEIEKKLSAGFDPTSNLEVRPTVEMIRGSTLQSAEYQRSRPLPPAGNGEPVRWHVVIQSVQRFDVGDAGDQRYALAVSLEHEDANLRLYQTIRERVRTRQRVHWAGAQ